MESVAEESTTSWTWMIVITLGLSLAWYFINSAIDIAEVSRNWPKYRCSPSVMPFASLYGYDTTENFNYCLSAMFKGETGSVTGPFTSILGVMMKNMMVFLNSLNNIRMMFATFIGGITKIIQEFTDRFKLIFSQVRITSLRLQVLMQRVFATMYSVIYMGMSGVTAGLNFGDTFIFKFMDTFCFPPETEVDIVGRGLIPIATVKLGDIFTKTGAKVTSLYQFQADGQAMVWMEGGVEVSTNHFVRHEGEWIPSANHPEAHPVGYWNGGSQRPLICLDTDTHEIPIGSYIFSDWDETSNSDQATMEYAEKRLNGGDFMDVPRNWLYQPAIEKSAILIRNNNEEVKASAIKLNDRLSTGKVVGVGRRHVYSWCRLPTGEKVTPSTLVWDNHLWKRAGHLYPESIETSDTPIEMVTLVILKTACMQTKNGVYFRDMCEIHSPDMEEHTTKAMTLKSVVHI